MEMKRSFRFFPVAAGLGLAAFSPAQNLLANSGFETNTQNSGFLNWWGDVPDGWRGINSPDMWDNAGDHGNQPGYDSVSMVGAHAHSGTKFVGMASKATIGFYEGLWEGLSVNLTEGTSYTVSAWVYTDTDYSMTPGFAPIRVSWSDSVLGWLEPNTARNVWERREFAFTATAEMASYRQAVQFFAFGTGNAYLGLDDVGLAKTPVPEPSLIATTVTGLVGLTFRRRSARARLG